MRIYITAQVKSPVASKWTAGAGMFSNACGGATIIYARVATQPTNLLCHPSLGLWPPLQTCRPGSDHGAPPHRRLRRTGRNWETATKACEIDARSWMYCSSSRTKVNQNSWIGITLAVMSASARLATRLFGRWQRRESCYPAILSGTQGSANGRLRRRCLGYLCRHAFLLLPHRSQLADRRSLLLLRFHAR